MDRFLQIDPVVIESFYRQHLIAELKKRTARNPNYSVRSFARVLKVSPGSLSEVLNGKRSISKKVADRILDHLELSERDRGLFLRSIVAEKQDLGIRKVDAALNASAARGDGKSGASADLELDAARFSVISDWYHYAILEMTFKKDFRLETRWISERLGISPAEAKTAIRNLITLGLIEKKGKRWAKSRVTLDTLDQTKTSRCHRKRVLQILEKSARSLQEDPLEIRNHTATTVCVDPSRIPEAKRKLQKFLWELTHFLEGDRPSRVYEISLQAFPLEKADEP